MPLFVVQVFHEELLGKEPIVASLRTKAHELLEHKEQVPGLKDVKRQLRQLEKRWTSLKVCVEMEKSWEAMCVN